MNLSALLQKVDGKRDLSRAEAESAMEELLSGRIPEGEIVRLLSGLREKGETVEEIVGFASAMRRHAKNAFPPGHTPPPNIVDTCGTGGGTPGTFNISTCAAFVAAGAGVRVAKHGNRSHSSKSGSADVLEALGVRVDIPIERAGAAIEEIGIGFLFAQLAHASMRHAAAARKKLGGQTIMNLLGPLTNPAGARAQVMGVFAAKWVEPEAKALAELGSQRAFVVHGADGLDEVSLSGETFVSEVIDGKVRNYRVAPDDFGLEPAPLEAISGGDAADNASIIRAILNGERGSRRDIAIANAAAAIVAGALTPSLLIAAQMAADAIDSRTALQKMNSLIDFTNRP
ncbi:MAG TPA: anthranilate phosphoribosyltransferase [Candidatus Acidoferrum sp.]|nr:anthranilate phosphoribosyltransferase [Candidatus Acidoferrum sp.]